METFGLLKAFLQEQNYITDLKLFEMQLIDLIGNTPLVQIRNLSPNPDVKIFAKLEGQNPGGSVKDRAALGMIQDALKQGRIKPGDKLIEATSGNTGIALAMIARLYDLQMILVMPENSSAERIQTMKAYGAKVILTPSERTIEYSRTLVEELADSKGYFMLNQFGNHSNPNMHYRTTGPEIWKDTNGQITHFVSAMGTTGTIMGVSKFLKKKNAKVQIVGTQPTEGSKIPGIRRWSPEFLPTIFEAERVDQIIDISEEEAITTMKRMAKEESLFVGVSSGGAMAAAIKLADKIKSGHIVTIACDRGDRYLSTDLFA